jgi:surface antigen
MKTVSKIALAALVIAGTIATATPAHAVSYYDSYGRPYYYNTWGQPVYYDTGYNATTVYAPAPAAQPVYTQTTYSAAQPVYQEQRSTTTTYSNDAPLLAATPTYAPATYAPADASQTTYQYYYPDGSSAATTYVSATSSAPATVCRQTSSTNNDGNNVQTRYSTECQQNDGTWIQQ